MFMEISASSTVRMDPYYSLVRSVDEITMIDVNSVNGFMQIIVFPSRMVNPS